MNENYVSDKDQMYRLLRTGEFGNTLGAIDGNDTLAVEALAAVNERLAIRSKRKNGELRMNVWGKYIWQEVMAYCKDNQCLLNDLIIVQTDKPGGRRTFTAEVRILPVVGIVVVWSTTDALYREAMRPENRGPVLSGMRANALLESKLDPIDLETLKDLLKTWDAPVGSAVVELTCFEKPLGVMHRRMVVWEVRSY